MAKILKENIKIDFGNKVWSSNEQFDAFPAAFVHVLSNATLDGNNGGIDMYSNFGENDFDDRNNSCFAITVGDMKTRNEDGSRGHIATSHEEAMTCPKGNLTIDGGTYMAVGCTCVYVTNGTCVINDGTFFSQPSSSTASVSNEEKEKYGPYRSFLLNLYDKFGKWGDAKIVVKGGSYIGFDPADNYAEGDHTNFVATGYKSVEDGEYTYAVKDTNRPDNGTLVTVKVYTVVPSNDEREGIEGTQPLS